MSNTVIEPKIFESEKLFSAIFHKSPIGISLVHLATGKQVDVNDACFSIFGYSREEIIDQTSLDLNIYMDERDRHELIEELTKKHSVKDKEVHIVRKNKEKGIIQASAEIIEIENEKYALVMITDITEKKKTEKELIESEERFRQITETIQDVFWMSELNMKRIYYVSPAFEKIWGRSAQSLYDDPASGVESVHPEDREKFMKIFNIHSPSGPFTVEYRIITPSGEIRHLLDRGFPIYNDIDNQVIRYVGVAKDITDQKEAARKIQQINEELEHKVNERTIELTEANIQLNESNATKDKFFSIIAHDLKNPFNSILSHAQLILMNLEMMDSIKIRKNIKHISSSAESAYRLLENLLEWAKAQTGGLTFQPEETDLNTLFLTAQESTQNIAIHKKISVMVEPADIIIVNVDVNMINAVFRNLITNAIKFTPSEGKITLKAIPEGDKVIVSVADTGVGMSRETISKLFKISEKVSKPGTENEPGTGLGLILCKEFVEKNGGTINVESEEGRGSIFSFSLPVVKG
jgi:PAS domain S-box-containing protein